MTASDPDAVGHLRSCKTEAVHTWDGTGVCLFAKRLEDGKFRWPKMEDGVIRLTAAQLSALLEGLDWRRVHEAKDVLAPEAVR
jgi:transposase